MNLIFQLIVMKFMWLGSIVLSWLLWSNYIEPLGMNGFYEFIFGLLALAFNVVILIVGIKVLAEKHGIVIE